MILICCAVGAQNHAKAFAAADSTNFRVNKHDGWQLFNSYVAKQNTDSVDIELIIQHNHSIDWKQEQLVGKIITHAFIPQASRTVQLKHMFGDYKFRIDTTGKCYIQLVAGMLPNDDPAILLVRTVYKL